MEFILKLSHLLHQTTVTLKSFVTPNNGYTSTHMLGNEFKKSFIAVIL